jgi:hypothetical protein
MSGGEAPRRPRLRWLSLAEIVGIAALAIAGLGWWESHREHQQQDRDRAAAASDRAADQRREALRSTFLLVGSVEGDGGRIRLASARPDQVIETQSLVFPTAVRRDPVETTGNPRLERDWFADGLKHALHDRGGKSDAARMPLGVATSYVEGGETKTDKSIYLVACRFRSRMLRGAQLQLEGASLLRRGVSGDLSAAVDQAWARTGG